MGDLERLRAELRRLDRVVVAFSGGSDSAFLAWVANDTLGPASVLCATAVSASLADDERADCAALAGEWKLRWRALPTGELGQASYLANGPDRCYHCKSELLDALGPISLAERSTVVLGVNCDDLGDHRPGQRAAVEKGAEFPLVAAGFTKSDVRTVSRELGLRTWNKPAAACLASRIPYGTPVTLATLEGVGKAEASLRRLGFSQIRVRHYGDLARVEVEEAELARAVQLRRNVIEAVQDAGYIYVTLDLEGFRSGNLNHSLKAREAL